MTTEQQPQEGSIVARGDASARSAGEKRKRVRRKPVPASQLPTDWWEVEDCALYLGKSDDWVYKKTADGTLPSHKHGRSNRYKPVEIVAWADAQGRA